MYQNWSHTCFVAGTNVLMANGTTKNIEDISNGDMILSVNTDNMLIEEDLVLELPIRVKKYRKISMKLSDGTELEFSPAHPFWVIGKGWSVVDLEEAKKELRIEVSQMSEGDILLKYINGKLISVKVLDLKNTGESVEMYNAEHVKKNHSFFANGILVHNKR